jgi:hypothetical protein
MLMPLGIPLLAASLGPLANVSSIAALVTSWREQVYINGEFVSEFEGVPFSDPRWYAHSIFSFQVWELSELTDTA